MFLGIYWVFIYFCAKCSDLFILLLIDLLLYVGFRWLFTMFVVFTSKFVRALLFHSGLQVTARFNSIPQPDTVV